MLYISKSGNNFLIYFRLKVEIWKAEIIAKHKINFLSTFLNEHGIITVRTMEATRFGLNELHKPTTFSTSEIYRVKYYYLDQGRQLGLAWMNFINRRHFPHLNYTGWNIIT
jgi:hypothetical protein